MGELSIEEKAKAYDEAIERARKINSGEGVAAPPDWTTCEVIFPELKESDDERIRKALIQHIKCNVSVISGWRKEELIAWLEKQGSQNLANSAKTCKIEQKPTLPGFEEQEGVAGRDYIPVEWVEAIENYGKWKIVRVNEQNPAWSEEDEIRFESTLHRMEIVGNGCAFGQLKDDIDWLKSLKERYTWKPSDEQMEALYKYVTDGERNLTVGESVLIQHLYNDLKKLKG